MEVTLRKAAALSKSLLETARGLQVTKNVTVSVYSTTTVADEVAAAQNKLETVSQKIVNLTRAAYAIRKTIGETNAKVGLDALLTENAAISAVEKIITDLVGTKPAYPYEEEDVSDLEVAQAQLESLRERAKVVPSSVDRYGRPQETVSVNVLNETLSQKYREELAASRRRKVEIADEVLALNMTHKVELEPEVVGLLKEFKLI